MSIASLKWKGVREFRIEDTGKFRTARNGKRIPITQGVLYVDTVGEGRMKLEDWYSEFEKAVDEEGKTDLLEKIIAECKKLAWLRTEKDVRHYAMECMSDNAYKAWRNESR